MSEKVRIPFTFVVRSATWRPDSDPSPDEPKGPTLVGRDGAVLPIGAELHPSPVIDDLEAWARRNYFEGKAAEATEARKRAREEEAASREPMPVSPSSSRLTASLYGNLRQRKQVPAASEPALQADAVGGGEHDPRQATGPAGTLATMTVSATALSIGKYAAGRPSSTQEVHPSVFLEPRRVATSAIVDVADTGPDSADEDPSEQEDGRSLASRDQDDINTREYRDAFTKLSKIDPRNPALGPVFRRQNWQPSDADVQQINSALARAQLRSSDTQLPQPFGADDASSGATEFARQLPSLSTSEQTNVERLMSGGRSKDAATIITRSQSMMNSSEFEKLRNAHARNIPAEIDIGGVEVIYEPTLPPDVSGMSLFGSGGFIIGPAGFRSETELKATVLQEMYRLSTSRIGPAGRGAVGEVREETRDAQSWANDAAGAVEIK